MRTPNHKLLSLALSACLGANAWAQDATPRDLTQASLEDLMNIQVTSVSKKDQKLSRVGAAVYVITQEDIRRSGMANIPDLLRMVPGVNVARISSSTWAISIRGFNQRYSNKVLVLIDGRSVYTPAFSGVFWDQQTLPLEDIDRIEVIRGPGGTVWGANAVNGVINIITKKAQDTQGGLIRAGTGSAESANSVLQYGGRAGRKGFYRAYGRYFNVESATAANGDQGTDGWHGYQGGFRSDWALSPRDALTVQGDLSRNGEGETVVTLFSNDLPNLRIFNDRVNVGSGNILGRWDHTLANGSETSVQVYYSRFSRFELARADEGAADADFQYHFSLGSRQDIVAGAGYRFSSLNLRDGYAVAMPPNLTTNLYSTFVQDEVKLTNSLTFTLGSKFEHNEFTGFEFEPSAQLVWTPRDHQAFWLSAARAIRQPSWFDRYFSVDAATFPLEGGGFGLLKLLGSQTLQAEELRDFEAGYRTELSNRVSLDVTGFWSQYRHLATYEPAAPFFTPGPPPHMVFPLVTGNLAHARDYGAEFFANLDVTKWWRISPGFSFLQMQVRGDPSSQDFSAEATPGYTPKHQVELRSTVDLPHNMEWDTSMYYVGALGNGPLPGYTRLDTRFGWRPGESLEFSVAGQNLLTPHHFEFLNGVQIEPTQVERSVVGKVTWRF